MEENSNQTQNTTNTTEVKQNWFKSHMPVCIIAGVVVIAAVVVVVFLLMNNGGQSPEKVVETYVQAMQEGNVDKLMNITDLKGAYAWYKCGKKAEKFEETYNKISDNDIKSYEKTFKSGLNTAFGMLKSFGGVQISINNMGKPEEISKGLYKIKANIKMKVSVLGTEQEQDQDLSLAVYNGKFIGDAK